jgi:DNA-binding NarL/FixJ family response regulator
MSLKEEVAISTLHNTKYKIEEGVLLHVKKETLDSYFENANTKPKRNEAILNAFENDYSRSDIARHLGLSVAGVSKILKKLKV